MRCHICDRLLGEPHYNSEHKDWDPCDTCQEVINDTVGSFKDTPSADEEDLGLDPSFEGLYPQTTDPRQDQ